MWVKIILFLLLGICAVFDSIRQEIPLAVVWTGIALAVALTMFLSEYLLYRYDHDDAPEEEA